jgi:HSP20 family molecular chaperone IbpA
MYLHNLTDSREAAQRLERFFRRLRGKGSDTTDNIRATILKADGQLAIRMELPGAELDDIVVHDDILTIKFTVRRAQATGTGAIKPADG